MKPKFQIGIKNNVSADAGGNVLDLYFLDAIRNPEYYDWESMSVQEGSLVADVISQVKYYNPSKIICHIDSLGGDLFIATSLYNFLKDYSAKVECKIVGFCASAACVIACAASPGKLTIPVNGWYITHESSGNEITGSAKFIREQADIVEGQTKNMAEIMASRNTKGKTSAEILALWTNGDCWMTGTEAEEFGFVDSCYNSTTAIVTAQIKEASLIYKNVPAGAITAEIVEDEAPTSFFTALKKEFMELKLLVTAAIGKIKTNKVDPASTNISADIAEAIAGPLSEMAEAMQAEIATEREGMASTITAELEPKITAAVEAKHKTTIEALQKSVTDLTADLERLSGKESGKAEPVTADANKKTLTGKFAGEQA